MLQPLGQPHVLMDDQPRVSCCHKFTQCLQTAAKICNCLFLGFSIGVFMANQGRLNFPPVQLVPPDQLVWSPPKAQLPLLTHYSTALVAQPVYSTAIARFQPPSFKTLPAQLQPHQFNSYPSSYGYLYWA